MSQKADRSDIVMNMVDALKRFESMSYVEVFQIVGEISILNVQELDISDTKKRYSLSFLPGEKFSGLQCLCMMYVGFKKTRPDISPKMDWESEYKEAIDIYNSG